MASKSLVGLHRAGCTWWPSHTSWMSPGWQWPPIDTFCPDLPVTMAVCPLGMGTSHCCLRGRKSSVWLECDRYSLTRIKSQTSNEPAAHHVASSCHEEARYGGLERSFYKYFLIPQYYTWHNRRHQWYYTSLNMRKESKVNFIKLWKD